MTNSQSKSRNSPNKQKQQQYYNASFDGSPCVSSRHSNNSSPNQKKNGSFFANNRKSSDTLMTSSTSSNAINNLQTPYKYNNSFNNNSNVSPNNSRSHRASAPISIMGNGHSPTRTSPTKFYQNHSNNNSFNGSCSPSNPDYFAGSKCFDAPKPDELPKPPKNWFGSCSAEFGKQINQNKIRNLPILPMTA